MERIITGRVSSLQSVLSDTTQPTTGVVFIPRGGWSVIDNYEKQRGKTTDNQIRIITVDKKPCYTSEKLTDVILIGF